jgi:hypothetical protein
MTEKHHPHDRQRAHDSAIVHAEARHIVLALAPFGVLDRDALAHRCGQVRWKDGTFDAALAQAIVEGAIEELPGGFYRAAS